MNEKKIIKISWKCVPKGPSANILALVQIMSWRRPGDNPLSEPMVISLLTHTCVSQPERVKAILLYDELKITFKKESFCHRHHFMEYDLCYKKKNTYMQPVYS